MVSKIDMTGRAYFSDPQIKTIAVTNVAVISVGIGMGWSWSTTTLLSIAATVGTVALSKMYPFGDIQKTPNTATSPPPKEQDSEKRETSVAIIDPELIKQAFQRQVGKGVAEGAPAAATVVKAAVDTSAEAGRLASTAAASTSSNAMVPGSGVVVGRVVDALTQKAKDVSVKAIGAEIDDSFAKLPKAAETKVGQVFDKSFGNPKKH